MYYLNQLDKFFMINNTGLYAMKPVRFSSIEFLGSTGSDWHKFDFNLSKILTQNVLYAAYHEPKTIKEISEFLFVQTDIIEEEIEFLENNGFMDRLAGNKFLTKILIHDLTADICEERHRIYMKYAKIVCEKYVPLILNSSFYKACLVRTPPNGADGINASLRNSQTHLSLDSCLLSNSVYTPENDLNFLLWSVITFACSQKFNIPEINDNLQKYYTKRNDGSENIAYASINNDINLSFNNECYKTFGELIIRYPEQEAKNLSLWQYNTFYDDRLETNSRGLSMLYQYFDTYLNSTSRDRMTPRTVESMFYRGLLTKHNEKACANLLIIDKSMNEFINILPDFPKEFIQLNHKLAEETFNLCKSQYPSHINDLNYAYFQKAISSSEIITRVLDLLQKDGTLKPLTESQKKTVNMIMFAKNQVCPLQ